MYSILIIEDDVALRSNMELILQMEGFDICTASDGISGIARMQDKQPDIILCDIMLPEMDGHAVLQSVRQDDRFADIPFIFVTALDERGDIRKGMAAGADDYLTKPFSAEELITSVTSRLQRINILYRNNNKATFQKETEVLLEQITVREREILVLVGQGYTSKEIAQQLGIRHNTVEVHRANLMKKLDTPNAANLARWAFIAEQIATI